MRHGLLIQQDPSGARDKLLKRQNPCLKSRSLGYKIWQRWMARTDQPATAQMLPMDTPLDHAQEEAIPLGE